MTEINKSRLESNSNNNNLEAHPVKFPDILGGVTFISVGIVLLLNNLGVISWSIWNYLMDFWPVIFIFIGLEMISENTMFLKLITTIIGFMIIGFILSYCLTSVDKQFQIMMFDKYPIWEKIYQAFPKPLPNLFWDSGMINRGLGNQKI